MYPANNLTSVSPAMSPRWVKTALGDPLVFDLDTIKAFLKIPLEDTFWDSELLAFAKSAQATIEQYCVLSLTLSSYIGYFWYLNQDVTLLNQRPFLSVVGITYIDGATGVQTGVAPSTYLALPTTQFRGAIYPAENSAWPNWATRPDAVQVTLTAGYDPIVNPMPDDIANALLMTIAALWSKRGDEGGGSGGGHSTVFALRHPGLAGRGALVIPQEARALLGPYTLRHL